VTIIRMRCSPAISTSPADATASDEIDGSESRALGTIGAFGSDIAGAVTVTDAGNIQGLVAPLADDGVLSLPRHLRTPKSRARRGPGAVLDTARNIEVEWAGPPSSVSALGGTGRRPRRGLMSPTLCPLRSERRPPLLRRTMPAISAIPESGVHSGESIHDASFSHSRQHAGI
jgi:hypothetical protein